MLDLQDKDYKNLMNINEWGNAKKGKDLLTLLRQYSIPLISLVLFLSIVIIFVFPTANNIFNNIKLTEKANEETNKLQKQVNDLGVLRDNDFQITTDLELIDRIVPSEKTKIVGLQQFIDDTVKEYKLTLEDISISEELKKVGLDGQFTSVSNGTGAVDLDLNGNPLRKTEDSLRVAPTTATIKGRFADVTSFFTDFYKIKDLFIIDSMSLTAEQDISPSELMTSNKIWTLEITFAKYAFSEDFLIQENQFNQVSANTQPDNKVLKYLRKRFNQ